MVSGSRFQAWAVLLAALATSSAYAGPNVTQSLTLNPGWNAIYLEVQPSNNSLIAVFQGIPYSSVWQYRTKSDPAQFVKNLDEQHVDRDQWLVSFNTNRVEKMFNNLFQLHANTAYIVKLLGSSTVPLTVTGRPAVPQIVWQAAGVNLVGFPLMTSGPLPSVASFFSSSTALVDQAVYRLSGTGTWQLVADPSGENMLSGESMWVYALTGTDYDGPVHVSVPTGDGLDYGGSVNEISITIENRSTAPAGITLSDVGGGAGGELAYWVDLGGGAFDYQDLSSPLSFSLTSGVSRVVRMAVRRENMAGSLFETTLEVDSDAGTRVFIPVSATK